MTVNILIPTALRNYAGGSDSVAVDAGTVGAALDSLTGKYPELKKHLYNDEGQLRHFVNIYVNDEDIRYCLLYTSPSPRDRQKSRMPSSA